MNSHLFYPYGNITEKKAICYESDPYKLLLLRVRAYIWPWAIPTLLAFLQN